MEHIKAMDQKEKLMASCSVMTKTENLTGTSTVTRKYILSILLISISTIRQYFLHVHLKTIIRITDKKALFLHNYFFNLYTRFCHPDIV